jgi:hypothetical protein
MKDIRHLKHLLCAPGGRLELGQTLNALQGTQNIEAVNALTSRPEEEDKTYIKITIKLLHIWNKIKFLV